jgi:hypothetical protein
MATALNASGLLCCSQSERMRSGNRLSSFQRLTPPCPGKVSRATLACCRMHAHRSSHDFRMMQRVNAGCSDLTASRQRQPQLITSHCRLNAAKSCCEVGTWLVCGWQKRVLNKGVKLIEAHIYYWLRRVTGMFVNCRRANTVG